jgi:hypothetical protein
VFALAGGPAERLFNSAAAEFKVSRAIHQQSFCVAQPDQPLASSSVFWIKSLSDHPKPANEYHLKTGQRERRPGH